MKTCLFLPPPPPQNLEKQKLAGLEVQKRPLMLTTLNGLSVGRVPGREDCRGRGSRVPMDERVSTSCPVPPLCQASLLHHHPCIVSEVLPEY